MSPQKLDNDVSMASMLMVGPKYYQAKSKHVGEDLRHTCQVCDIPYNIKSHSFRIT